MKRRFRLTRSTDFKRVRSIGKSFAYPLVVLIAAPSEAEHVRIGIAAGRSTGGAVSRNRAKRLLREACRPLVPQLSPGKDIILIARASIVGASLTEVQEAIKGLFRRAHLGTDF